LRWNSVKRGSGETQAAPSRLFESKKRLFGLGVLDRKHFEKRKTSSIADKGRK